MQISLIPSGTVPWLFSIHYFIYEITMSRNSGAEIVDSRVEYANILFVFCFLLLGLEIKSVREFYFLFPVYLLTVW